MAVARHIDAKPTIASELSLGEPFVAGGSFLCFGKPHLLSPFLGTGMGIPTRQGRAIPLLRCVNARRLERTSLALWITVHWFRVDLASAERKAGINSFPLPFVPRS
jgi:hypothetical protein